MKLKKLILENFLTYEELEYDFQEKALLVQGINLTDTNQKSNGSGKSAIQTGIEFALTSSNSRGVNDKELITYGFDKSRVQLFIQCDNRKETLHIDWSINSKGSNKLSLKLNEASVSFSNVNDGKKQILDWLAISKEDLFNYFIINSTRFKSFFGSSNREKVDLINRFSDSSIIDGLEDIDNSVLELGKSNLEHIINKSDGKLELLEEQIASERNKDFTEELEYRKRELESQIKTLDSKIYMREVEIDDINVACASVKVSISDSDVKIQKIKDSIKPIELEIKDKTDDLLDLKDDLIEHKDKITAFKLTDYDTVRDSHNSKISDVGSEMEVNELGRESAQNNISKIEKFMKGVEVKLSGTIDCPKCSHQFVLDGDREILLTKETQAIGLLAKYKKELQQFIDIEDVLFKKHVRLKDLIGLANEKERTELSAKRVLDVNLSDHRAIINDAEDTLSQLKRKSTKTVESISDINEGIRELNHDYKELQLEKKGVNNRIKEFNSSIKSIKVDIANLKTSDNKETINNLLNEVKIIKKARLGLDAKLVKINDEIYDRNKWGNNFKQFRLHLANKSLETMQYQTNKFLKDLGNDIVVRLDGYKVKANGTIKEEISAVIIRDGERTFSSLSGGEQIRVLFSSILANRHLINTTHPYGGLDFLSVDEVFDRIDSVGMKHLIRSAKKLETCIMVISHVSDEDLSGEEILTIQKINGVSTIKQ